MLRTGDGGARRGPLAREVERILAGAHEFTELRLLGALRSGAVRLPTRDADDGRAAARRRRRAPRRPGWGLRPTRRPGAARRRRSRRWTAGSGTPSTRCWAGRRRTRAGWSCAAARGSWPALASAPVSRGRPVSRDTRPSVYPDNVGRQATFRASMVRRHTRAGTSWRMDGTPGGPVMIARVRARPARPSPTRCGPSGPGATATRSRPSTPPTARWPPAPTRTAGRPASPPRPPPPTARCSTPPPAGAGSRARWTALPRSGPPAGPRWPRASRATSPPRSATSHGPRQLPDPAPRGLTVLLDGVGAVVDALGGRFDPAARRLAGLAAATVPPDPMAAERVDELAVTVAAAGDDREAARAMLGATRRATGRAPAAGGLAGPAHRPPRRGPRGAGPRGRHPGAAPDAVLGAAVTVGLARRSGDADALAATWHRVAPVIAGADVEPLLLDVWGELSVGAALVVPADRDAHRRRRCAPRCVGPDPPGWGVAIEQWWHLERAVVAGDARRGRRRPPPGSPCWPRSTPAGAGPTAPSPGPRCSPAACTRRRWTHGRPGWPRRAALGGRRAVPRRPRRAPPTPPSPGELLGAGRGLRAGDRRAAHDRRAVRARA